jgi:hypothetical protein
MEVSGQLHPPAALPPGKGPPVSIGFEDRWAPEPVWTRRLRAKSSFPAGNQTSVVQAVVSYYTDWATPALIHYVITE